MEPTRLSNRALAALCLACAFFGATTTRVSLVCAQASPPQNGTWIEADPVHTQVMVGDDGQTYVAIWLDVPAAPRTTRRPPMAVSIVVDTSGSMAGTKIEQARRAALQLLETVRDGDVVSVLGFESQVWQHVAPTVVTQASRRAIVRAIEGIDVGGGTAMYDGLAAGLAALSQASSEHPVRRLFLISDGHANVGPSSAEQLGALAATGLQHDVHVTGIGVGVDYDPATVGQVVVRSAGRFYHLAEPHQLAGVVAEEIAALSQTLATNAVVEFEPADGVRVLEGVTEGSQVTAGRFQLSIGSLYTGRRVELLVHVQLPTDTLGAHSLGVARLRYELPNSAREARVQERPVTYTVTQDRRAATRSVSSRAYVISHTQLALRDNDRAVEALRSGDQQAAATALAAAAARLEVAANEAPSAPARARLNERAATYRRQSSSSRSASSGAAQRDVGATIRADAYHDSAY